MSLAVKLRESWPQARFEQARGLHGKCRGTGDDAAALGKLLGGTDGGQRIDAPVKIEAAVLIGFEQER